MVIIEALGTLREPDISGLMPMLTTRKEKAKFQFLKKG